MIGTETPTRRDQDTPSHPRRPMRDRGHTWAILLAGGRGRRVSSLTRRGRQVVPKQYCSLHGNVSLLRLAMERAARHVPADRMMMVVAPEHRRWWEPESASLPVDSIIVQPRDRGTAAGLLLPLLHVLARDPEATVIVFPTDHYVADEWALQVAVQQALSTLRRLPRATVLVGVQADTADPEVGWILPATSDVAGGARPVSRFVEKPDAGTARRLLAAGAVVNTFILTAAAQQLRRRIEAHLPVLARAFSTADQHPPAGWLEGIYAALPRADFSHDVLAAATDGLLVVSAPGCGWNDLGTPPRVARCLAAVPQRAETRMLDLPRGLTVPVELSTRVRGHAPFR